MKKFYLLLVLLFASCSNVTETGNPCPAGNCPYASPNLEASELYVNDKFGVAIEYPAGWTYEEDSDRMSVDFESEGPERATAHIIFERLDPQPESLFAHIFEAYPYMEFANYSTMSLTGYSYDNPDTGQNGGDLKEYFFLIEDIFIHVEAELFPSRTVEFGSLLNGISLAGE